MLVINVGKVPPPYGGVSTFIKRFVECLNNAQINNVFFDVSGFNKSNILKIMFYCIKIFKMFFVIIKKERSIVIFHSKNILSLLVLNIFNVKHKTILFIHGESLINNNNKIIKILLSNINYIVVPTNLLKSKLEKKFNLFNVTAIPFILYPVEYKITKNKLILNFINKHKNTMSAYAYKLSFFNDVDLYGVDMLIYLIIKLVKNKHDIGLILLLPNIDNQVYYKKIIDQIKLNNIENYILIITEPIADAIELYASTDIYVRPSNTDGDSFSIRESLYAGTPVVTSDAVVRPEGCVIFKNRDNEDLFAKTLYAIENLKEIKLKIKMIKINGSENELIDFLSTLLTN